MVSISELFPYVAVDQVITLTPIELALCVYAVDRLYADGVDDEDIDDMRALIDYVMAVLQLGGEVGVGVNFTVGQISMMANNTYIPDKWLECDGRAISRTTYVDLFDVCGVIYGSGDGTTTFNIPNLTGRVPMGRGTLAPEPNRSVGAQVGSAEVALSIAQLPAHTHTVPIRNDANTGVLPARGGGTITGTAASSSVGSGQAHPNIQPSLVVAFMIYAGI